MTALQPTPTPGRHPIGVAAERTGLSQDVIRVWERRYGAVEPQRGPGGQRVYTDADLERLTLLHAVTRAGRSIGQVAGLATEALVALVEEDRIARQRRGAATGASDVIATALECARSADASRLEEELRRASVQMGVPAFLEEVAVPLLRLAGDEWEAGRLSPAQEHLLSSVLHDLTMETMRSFTAADTAPRIVVATLTGERHVIGAALAGTLAALEGWRVIYLGADLPAADVADSARTSGARAVAVSVIYLEDRLQVLEQLRELRSRLPANAVLIAGGAGAGALASELSALGVRVASSLDGWVQELRTTQGDAE